MLLYLINAYTNEAGLRDLTRNLEKIIRKLVVQDKLNERTKISKTRLKEYLGVPKYLKPELKKGEMLGEVNALGVTRALQETVQADLEAMQNIEVLKSTLTEIESTLNSAGIEASNIRVTELGDFIGQLASQVTELQTQISEAETQLEVLI